MAEYSARSIKDDLYGIGKKVGQDAYEGLTAHAERHYRRFLDLDILCSKLETLGFQITDRTESNECAPFGNEKPVCIRVLAQK